MNFENLNETIEVPVSTSTSTTLPKNKRSRKNGGSPPAKSPKTVPDRMDQEVSSSKTSVSQRLPDVPSGSPDDFSGWFVESNVDENLSFDDLSPGAKMASYLSELTSDKTFVYNVFTLLTTLKNKHPGLRIQHFTAPLRKYEFPDFTKEDIEIGLNFNGHRDPLTDKLKKSLQRQLLFFGFYNLMGVLEVCSKLISDVEISQTEEHVIKVFFKENSRPLTIDLKTALFLENTLSGISFDGHDTTFSSAVIFGDTHPLLVDTHLFIGLRPLPFNQKGDKKHSDKPNFRFDRKDLLDFNFGQKNSVPTPHKVLSIAFEHAVQKHGFSDCFLNEMIDVGTMGEYFLLKCLSKLPRNHGDNALAVFSNTYLQRAWNELFPYVKEVNMDVSLKEVQKEIFELSKTKEGKDFMSFLTQIVGDHVPKAQIKFLFLIYQTTNYVQNLLRTILQKKGYLTKDLHLDTVKIAQECFKSNASFVERIKLMSMMVNNYRAIIKKDDGSTPMRDMVAPAPRLHKIYGAVALERLSDIGPAQNVVNFASSKVMDYLSSFSAVHGHTFYIGLNSDPERNIFNLKDIHAFTTAWARTRRELPPKNIRVNIIGPCLKMEEITQILEACTPIKDKVTYYMVLETQQFGQDERHFFMNTAPDAAYPNVGNFTVSGVKTGLPVHCYKFLHEDHVALHQDKIRELSEPAQVEAELKRYSQHLLKYFYKPLFHNIADTLDKIFAAFLRFKPADQYAPSYEPYERYFMTLKHAITAAPRTMDAATIRAGLDILAEEKGNITLDESQEKMHLEGEEGEGQVLFEDYSSE